MARGTNDVRRLGTMFSPGVNLVVDSMCQFFIPMVFIAFSRLAIAAGAHVFAVGFAFAARRFLRKINSVSTRMREQFGTLNAGLNEAVWGIEVVKVTGQEG